MQRSFIVAVMLFLVPAAFGQSNASLGGTVRDGSGALIPGVEVTHNFSGSSFAVANFTGLICRLMYNHDVRTNLAVRSLLS